MDGRKCQDQQLCKDSNGVASVCLPGWKHADDLSSHWGSGAAPDGDADAITGMIFAVKAIANDATPPSWFNEVRAWADASASAFMKYNTIDDGSEYRLLKLGSYWGGWNGDGQNPSYHATGAYKLFRDYQDEYPAADRDGYSGYSVVDWNELIDTSYMVLDATSCPDRGMLSNWARVEKDTFGGLSINPGSFLGSGTPQHEFGPETARSIWPLALDAALYPTDVENDVLPLISPIVETLDRAPAQSWSQGTFSSCSAPGMSNNIYIFSSWLQNGFIYGPVLSSLIVPVDTISADQQGLIDDAGVKMSPGSLPTSYYPRCWILLANLALSGALSSSAGVLDFALPPAAPPTTPTPSPPLPPVTPLPTQSPVAASNGCCSHNFKDSVSWSCEDSVSTCGSCSSEAYQWLANGPVTGCMHRWQNDCQANSDCCDGLECRQMSWGTQCVHASDNST